MTNWKKLDAVMERFVQQQKLTGCGLRIFHDNELIYNHCFGSAAVDGSRPLTQDTRLRLHSMSKTFTCAGLMTLYDQGLFALDDPIAEYLPEFSNPMVCVSDTDISDTVPAENPITVRHLLTMTSGLPYWSFFPGEGILQDNLLELTKEIAKKNANGENCTLTDFVREVAKRPLCFQPGERWMYGLSHTVAGRLIEVLSGKRLSEYLRQAIWEPLELKHTCFVQNVPPEEKIAELTVLQELAEPFGLGETEATAVRDGKPVFGSSSDVLPGVSMGIELPCGGLSSTLEDLSSFFRMFANGGSWNGTQILARRTIDLMRTDHLGPNKLSAFPQVGSNKGFGYGLGYRTMCNAAEAGFYLPEGTFGWDGAAGCYGLANPDSHFAFVFVEQSIPHHIDYTIPRVVAAMNADYPIP